jgi:hypothetical protein
MEMIMKDIVNSKRKKEFAELKKLQEDIETEEEKKTNKGVKPGNLF